ncbi:Non-reducing end alpha-L-arabinofuranosidase BoGH43A [Paramyrothecium foliicola]|nr:Non-reducing end alpha-L-arabinofuranosidase BoGH43A [Paramyrothecium foliicola]
MAGNAALNTIGLISGGLGIISFFQELMPEPDPSEGATINIKAGRQQSDDPGMEGYISAGYAWDVENYYLGMSEGTDIEAGGYKTIVVDQESGGAQAAYVGISAGDNAVCVAWIAVTQLDLTKGGAWTGDIGYNCDQHWYEQNQVAGTIEETGEEYVPKCTWIDADHTEDVPSAALKFNIKAYGQDSGETYKNNAACDMTVWGPDDGPINAMPGKRSSRSQLPWMKQKLVVSKMASHKAENLCGSDKSWGPDFVGTDGYFCDMETKTLTPLCSMEDVNGCVEVDEEAMAIRKRSNVARREIQTTHKVYKKFDNWGKVIGLPNGKAIILTGGLFAPTIRHYNNSFHIVCTNACQDSEEGGAYFRNFLISCHEDEVFARDGWSDPVYFDFPGIDPSLFFDQTTGKAYVQGSYRVGPPWAPDCSIRQFEIDIQTGKALSDIKLLWKGATTDAEGPHLYAKDGWYYLITAEGSTFDGHEINVARSRGIWGPYEGFSHNPLLTAFERDEDIKWTGHGDFVQDRNGNWFCVHLGVRHDRTNPKRHPLGRETFLTPMVWNEEDWPQISQTKMEFDIETAEAYGSSSLSYDNNVLQDVYIRTPQLDCYTASHDRQDYSLLPQPSMLASPTGTATFIGRRQRDIKCSASVTLPLAQFDGIETETLAGIALYKDCSRYAAITFSNKSRALVLEVRSMVDQKPQTRIMAKASVPTDQQVLQLRIIADSEGYAFDWMESNWQSMGSLDSVEMSGYDMTGTIFGLFASIKTETDDTKKVPVEFTKFRVE